MYGYLPHSVNCAFLNINNEYTISILLTNILYYILNNSTVESIYKFLCDHKLFN